MENEKKKNMGGIVLIVILVLIILGLVGFILVDKDIIKLKDNDIKEQQKIETQKEVEETISIEEAEKLLNKFGFYKEVSPAGDLIYEHGYSEDFKKIVALTSIDESVLETKNCSDIYSASSFDSNMNWYKGESGVCKDKTPVISYEDVNKVYIELYGENISKEGVNGTKVSSMFYHFYDYNESNNEFVKLECGSCGGTSMMAAVANKIKDVRLEHSELIINIYYKKIYPTNYNIASGFEINGVKLEATNQESAKKELEEKYLNELDIYELKFTKNNGNYVFKSLTKIK